MHVALRAGSDIAFLGGIVNYILEHGREFREYVTAYTNAAAIVNDDFRDTEDLDGLFSGWDPENKSYDESSWQYKDMPTGGAAGSREVARSAAAHGSAHGSHGASSMGGGKAPHVDPTLEDPRCVFQIVRRHFARYTPELVEEVCGVPPRRVRARRASTLRQQRARTNERVLLCRRMDAAHRGGPVHPHRRHNPAPARQHGAPRRRDSRAARARLDPGLDRHPHALRDPARLPPPAPRRAREPRRPHRGRRGRGRLLGKHALVLDQLAHRMVGRRGDRGQRLLLRRRCPASPATIPTTRPCSG